jgi:2-aminoadipate transaminase
MFRACVDAGVLYVPGDYCFQPDDAGHVPTNHLRLSFGQVARDQIEPGIERLASVVRAGPAAAAPQGRTGQLARGRGTTAEAVAP